MDNARQTAGGREVFLSPFFRQTGPWPVGVDDGTGVPSHALGMLFFFCLFLFSAAGFAQSAQPAAENGKASWYGTTDHGRQTASGEVFSRDFLTAAHKTLPFGTVLRVRNERNGYQTLVRINDRGPFIKGRIVDVSRRAAEMLKMKQCGVVPVTLEVITNQHGEPLNATNAFYVQIASEKNPLLARMQGASLENRVRRQICVVPAPEQQGQPAYALCLGPYDTFEEAHSDFIAFERKEIPVRAIIEAPAEN